MDVLAINVVVEHLGSDQIMAQVAPRKQTGVQTGDAAGDIEERAGMQQSGARWQPRSVP